ncbi:MAG: hypothetical protein ACON5P_05130 [Candidatus Puniceispirillaceae bacterium]
MRRAVKIVFTFLAIAMLIFGLMKLYPYLRPTNSAFAPETPSQNVSPRLQGIFNGLGSGFSK